MLEGRQEASILRLISRSKSVQPPTSSVCQTSISRQSCHSPARNIITRNSAICHSTIAMVHNVAKHLWRRMQTGIPPLFPAEGRQCRCDPWTVNRSQYQCASAVSECIRRKRPALSFDNAYCTEKGYQQSPNRSVRLLLKEKPRQRKMSNLGS